MVNDARFKVHTVHRREGVVPESVTLDHHAGVGPQDNVRSTGRPDDGFSDQTVVDQVVLVLFSDEGLTVSRASASGEEVFDVKCGARPARQTVKSSIVDLEYGDAVTLRDMNRNGDVAAFPVQAFSCASPGFNDILVKEDAELFVVGAQGDGSGSGRTTGAAVGWMTDFDVVAGPGRRAGPEQADDR